MKKQDKIIQAWGSHWEKVKEFVDDNGFCHKRKKIMFDEIKSDIALVMDHPNYVYPFRPKSIVGIENNNDWRLMEDFDSEDDDYFLFLRYVEGEGEPPIFTSPSSCDFEVGYFTHYRYIDIFNPPIY